MAQVNHCSKCRAPIPPVIGKGIVTYMFGQTLGIKPRRKTSALPIYVCAPCAWALSIKPGPDETDFYSFTAYQIMRNLFGLERPEVQEALGRFFELLIEREGHVSDAELDNLLPEPEILTPWKALKSAV